MPKSPVLMMPYDNVVSCSCSCSWLLVVGCCWFFVVVLAWPLNMLCTKYGSKYKNRALRQGELTSKNSDTTGTHKARSDKVGFLEVPSAAGFGSLQNAHLLGGLKNKP